MSPVTALVASAFTHAGELIRSGTSPAKAMFDTAAALIAYDEAHRDRAMPSAPFSLTERPPAKVRAL